MIVDWDKFAARVPAGVFIQTQNFSGVLLENYAHRVDVMLGRCATEESAKMVRGYYKNNRYLRAQSFSDKSECYVLIDAPTLQYFIDNRWQTFNEVMA